MKDRIKSMMPNGITGLESIKPAKEGSYYLNYKGYHSVVLLGLVDANLTFIMADVGCNGRVSDAGVLQETTCYRKLKNGAPALSKHDDTVGKYEFSFSLQMRLLH
jgi:hypothetical protein